MWIASYSREHQRGFTLVELLVVIAIIALLVALLLPALGKAREAALSVACLSNEREIANAEQLYLSTYRGHGFDWTWGVWVAPLAPYVDKGQHVFICPATNINTTFNSRYGGQGSSRIAWQWNAPAGYVTYKNAQTQFFGSYCFNGWLYGGDNTGSADSNLLGQWDENQPFNLFYPSNLSSDDKNPAEIPFISDGIWPDCWPDANNPPPLNLDFTLNVAAFPSMYRVCINRHQHAVNVAFLDGHAAPVKLADLWKLPWNQQWVVRNPLPRLPYQ
jgi:prepilin-type N-terminal cleavage/methylation domain-containing protein/prepilin-type processing-associated H-X9-DG protein